VILTKLTMFSSSILGGCTSGVLLVVENSGGSCGCVWWGIGGAS
jgi:hypothetical protein